MPKLVANQPFFDQLFSEAPILESTSSSNLVIKDENMNSVSSSIENSENLVPERSATGQAYPSVEPERRKGHQKISTAIYYQDDRREFGYGNEEAQGWEAEGETG
jgi:hypothetical protein